MSKMDEKKIFIEPDDEITDVVDKIEETDKDIVVLTIPKSATILQSIVNFKLIKKKADENDKRLVVVSGSDRGRNLAEQVGISVYSKAKADEIVKEEKKKQLSDDNQQRFPLDMREKSSQKKKEKSLATDLSEKSDKVEKEKPAKGEKKKLPGWVKKLIWASFGVILIAGLAAAYYYLPKANVSLKIETDKEEGKVELSLKESSKLKESEVYGEMLDVESQMKDEFDATGRKQVGGKASGQITIYNYWSSEDQPLVATTRFVHNSTGKLFRTTSRVTVPGTQIVEGEQVPGTATVTIQANEPGSDFNVSSGQFTIPGLSSAKQEKIYGQSDSQMTGGYEKEILVVSQEDYNKAKKSLVDKLDEELTSKLQDKIDSDNQKLLSKKSSQIITESASPKVGQEAGSFELTLKKKLTTFAYNQTNLINQVKELFKEKISYEGQVIIENPNDQLEIKEIKINREDKRADLTAQVEVKLTPQIDQEILRDSIVGRGEAEAEKYLIGYSQIKDAQLDLWPFWVKSVPEKEGRINFKLQYE